jgi:hypothetical protein
MHVLAPDEINEIVKWYKVAIHCIDFHNFETVTKPNGEILVTMCADNCRSHFEIIVRDRLASVSVLTPEKCFVNLVASLWLSDAKCEIHPNGIVVSTAEGAIQVSQDL